MIVINDRIDVKLLIAMVQRSLPAPVPGLVIRYSYLWHSEQPAGREEPEKDRPCAIVAALRPAGDAGGGARCGLGGGNQRKGDGLGGISAL